MYRLSYRPFFFDTLKELNRRFGGLFKRTDEEDEQDIRRDKSGFNRWGWTITIDGLTGSDPTKAKYYYDLHVYEFLHWCLYFKEKQDEIKRQQEIEKLKNGN